MVEIFATGRSLVDLYGSDGSEAKKEMNHPVMPKRVGYLYDKMLDKDLIRVVILDSARHKYRRREVRKVLTHLEKYVERTYKILSEGSYVPTRPKLKTIYDNSSQKQRELKIVPFWPDGIVHRLLVEAMKPVLMRGMHPYSCASIPGRGGARIRKYLAHAMSCDPKGTRYACEMDIRHFYPSVPIRRLIRALGRKIKDKRFLRLIWAILKSCGQGLAIGYYICQWLANFYLEKLDWMLARMPGVKYYTRYMDNITMLGPNKRMLHRARVAAEKFLRDELGLAVKENWQVYRTAVARKAKGRPPGGVCGRIPVLAWIYYVAAKKFFADAAAGQTDTEKAENGYSCIRAAGGGISFSCRAVESL